MIGIGHQLPSRIFFFAAIASVVLLGGIFVSRPQVASAHPLGNFTINRYARINLGAPDLYLTYVLDMAEIPTFQEMPTIDTNGDGVVGPQEKASYVEQKAVEIKDGIILSLDDAPVALDLQTYEMDLPIGQAGLPTLRLSLLLSGQSNQSDGTDEHRLIYRDDNFAERLGWSEIVITPTEAVHLTSSSVPQFDRSNELTTYPDDLLRSPPNVREASSNFVWTGFGGSGVPEPALVADGVKADPGGLLGSLISSKSLSGPIIALAFLVALGLGAMHAASPGHGKTIMAAYLVGSRGTVVHALFLGLTVTVSHTIGILGIGSVVLYASHLVSPESLYPWLGTVSGAIIIGIGGWLIVSRIHPRHSSAGHINGAGEHIHSGSHRNNRLEGPETPQTRGLVSRFLTGMSRQFEHRHDHHRPEAVGGGGLRLTWKNLTALGIVGGLLPSASALIILLAAVSVHRIGFGLLLILAFSLGMAAVLSMTGVLLVFARNFLERSRFRLGLFRSFPGLIPLGTALIILTSGIVVTARAAYQIG